MTKPVYIFISDKMVIHVSGTKKHIVVNFDNLEYGNCPICHRKLYTEGDQKICTYCGINLDLRLDYPEIIGAYQKGKENGDGA